MWITAELVSKTPNDTGYQLDVLYSTDDTPPFTTPKSIFLGPGQDASTFKAAVIQQLADLNALDQQKKSLDTLKMTVDAIALGLIDTSTKLDLGGAIDAIADTP